MKPLIDKAIELGAADAVPMPLGKVVVANWVRLKCQFGCGGWGRCLTCPPYSLTPEQTSKILSEYRKALLVHSKGSHPGLRKLMSELERFAFLKGHYKAFAFCSGPCDLCDECNLKGPCRHPREARPSMEACGIDVFGTAAAAGLPIHVAKNRQDETNYYGLLLVE